MFVLLVIIGAITCAQGQRIPHQESFAAVLGALEKTAQDPEIKTAAGKAQKRIGTGRANDSLASSLLVLENLINFKLEEYNYLNYKPYKRELLFSLYEQTAALLQRLTPRSKSPSYASALHNLAVLIMRYDFASSQRKYNTRLLMEKAFRIREISIGPNHPDYAESLFGLAAAQHPGNDERALLLLQRVIDLSASGEGKAKGNYANALALLGSIYTGMHRYGEAARFLEKENEVRKSLLGAETPAYALRLYVTGDMLLYTGEYAKSLDYFGQALRLTKKTLGEQNLQYAYCLNGVGSVHYQVGDYREAVPYYTQSLAIKEKLKDDEGLPLALHQLATTYMRMGLYAQALPLFERACAVVEKNYRLHGAGAAGFGYFLGHLAAAYQTTHQYAQAYALLQKASVLTKNDAFFSPFCLQNLAILFENTGRPDSALFYLRKTLLLKKKKWGEGHPQYASALHQLSCLYAKTARIDTAILLCQQAAEIRRKLLGEEHAEYAASMNQLGELYTSLGKFDSAQHYLQRALAIREKALGPDHPDYASTLNSLGRLALATGETEEAAGLFTKSSTLWFNFLKRTYGSLSESEKVNLVNNEADQFGYLPSLLYGTKVSSPLVLQRVYATELLLKGMVLDDQQQVLRSIRNSGDSLAAALYFSWRSCGALLAKQCLLPPKKRLASFDSLQDRTNYLEQQLVRRSALFCEQKAAQAVSAKDVGASLQKGEAAIEFIRFRYYCGGWTDSVMYAAIVVLPGDSAGAFVPLCEESKLRQALYPAATGFSPAIKRLYECEGQNTSAVAGSFLYQLIWQPLQNHLLQVHTVYLAPAGLLHRVSFQALCAGDGRLLIDKYAVNQVFSTRSLVLKNSVAALPSAIDLWGNMAYGKAVENKLPAAYLFQKTARNYQPWASLPGTQKEIEGVEKVCATSGVRVNVVSGRLATEERFKALDGKSPEVLHLATHGMFDEEVTDWPGEAGTNGKRIALTKEPSAMLGSSLVMAQSNLLPRKSPDAVADDGILTAYEIAQMDLSKTKLAVLSACNTALGKLEGDEGVMGLQRALKLAGVNQMMISLWKVPDTETTELMQLFYTHWLAGRPPRDALRAAQLQLKSIHPSPLYWAAFVLVD